jgi:hypothetical protein
MKVKATANFSHPESDKHGNIVHVVVGQVIDVSDAQAKQLVAVGHVTPDLSWEPPEPARVAGNPEQRRGVPEKVESKPVKPLAPAVP